MNAPVELQQRLQTLEARQRRLRIWCLASTGLWIVSCVAAIAAPWHEELRVRRLVLVDESGKECGTLGTDKDGATLTLKSCDDKATVVVTASTAVFSEQHPSSSLSFSFPNGAMTVPEPGETYHEGPFSGLLAWTGDEKTPDAATSAWAGKASGFSIAHHQGHAALTVLGDDGPRLELEHGDTGAASLAVDEDGSLLSLEAGKDRSNSLEVGAGLSGCMLDGSWNDTYSFGLMANDEQATLSLAQADQDDDSDSFSEVELHAKDRAGSLELRSHHLETFRAPK